MQGVPVGGRAGVSGFVAVSNRGIDPGIAAFVAAAGPIAEATFVMAVWPETDECEWGDDLERADHLVGAILVRGHRDHQQAMGILNDGPFPPLR
jgi:hypothetical protein